MKNKRLDVLFWVVALVANVTLCYQTAKLLIKRIYHLPLAESLSAPHLPTYALVVAIVFSLLLVVWSVVALRNSPASNTPAWHRNVVGYGEFLVFLVLAFILLFQANDQMVWSNLHAKVYGFLAVFAFLAAIATIGLILQWWKWMKS